ncbi:MAG: hypothetical protein AMXMBFR58_36460 [Phycisphaerae bacterium]
MHATPVIGTETIYTGTEHPYLTGLRVRIVAVMKDAARPDHDPDAAYIRDDEDLGHVGGVTADDRVEVQPWLEAEGRYSWVTSDAKAMDLALFAHLRESPP